MQKGSPLCSKIYFCEVTSNRNKLSGKYLDPRVLRRSSDESLKNIDSCWILGEKTKSSSTNWGFHTNNQCCYIWTIFLKILRLSSSKNCKEWWISHSSSWNSWNVVLSAIQLSIILSLLIFFNLVFLNFKSIFSHVNKWQKYPQPS